MKLFYSLFVALLLCLSSMAQTTVSYKDLDTVSLITTRIPQKVSETGRHVTVLDATDIQRLPVQTLDELLRYVSGVEVQSRGPWGAQADILMRGSTFNQVLMLVDGMRINDPLTGHFTGYIPIAIPEIARIEVIKGPAAALYGPDAVGGVIHILTHTFIGEQQENAKGHYQANLVGGVHAFDDGQMFGVQTGGYQPGERVSIGGGIQYLRSNGELLPPDSQDVRNDVDLRTVSLSSRFSLSDEWSLMLRGAFDERTFNARHFYTRSTFDLSREQTRQGWVQGRLARQTEKSLTSVDAAWKIMRDSFLFNPLFPANIHTTQFLNLQLNHRQSLTDQIDIAVGLQADQRSIVSTDRGDHIDQHLGAYLMGYFRPAEGLFLTAGLRADADNNYGLEFLPQFNVSYATGRLTLRAGSGRGIRAADFTERYIGFNLPAPVAEGRNIGNPDLLAERSWSHEIGADIWLTKNVRFLNTFFLRASTNLVDYVLTPGTEVARPEQVDPQSTYFFTQNIAELQTYGWESEVNIAHYWKEKQGLDASLSMLLTDVRVDSLVATKYLSNIASVQVNGRITAIMDPIQFSNTFLFKRRDSDLADAINAELQANYFLWNSRLSFVGPQRKWQVFLQMYNVLGTQYQDILGAYMPGRWTQLGVTLSL